MSRKFGNDRSHQDKARAHYFALHGPQARRENAKERDAERAKRSDAQQLEVIAFRQKQGKDKGASAKEIRRLSLRMEAAVVQAAEKQKAIAEGKPSSQKPQGRQNQGQRGRR